MKKIVIAILVAALILFGASFGLNGIAAANAQKAHLEMMQLLLPGSENFTVEPYAGEDANIRSVHKAENGFVIETVTYLYFFHILFSALLFPRAFPKYSSQSRWFVSALGFCQRYRQIP